MGSLHCRALSLDNGLPEQGGIPEDERRAFLFTNVVDSQGRRYDIPVVVGAYAASTGIYAIGMGRSASEIGKDWLNAIARQTSHPFGTTRKNKGSV